MMNIKKNLLFIIMTIVLIFSMSVTFASTAQQEASEAYAALQGGGGEDGTVEGTLRTVANALAGIALAISMLKLAQIGMQFLMMPANKKSNAKASLVPWLVGVVICVLWLSIGNWFMEVMAPAAPKGPFDI